MRHIRHLCVMTWIVSTTALALAQQPARDVPARTALSGTAMLAGVVTVDRAEPQPLRRALVSLTGTSGNIQTVTDDLGRFAFTGLAAGRYTVAAEKPGYVKKFYGSKAIGRGPGTPVAVADGQQVAVALALLPGAVLAGTITDEHGAPLGSAQVSALTPITVDGVRRFVAPVVSSGWATTDDRGSYRIFGLPPGEYTVRAGAALMGGGPSGVRMTTEADVRLAEAALRTPGVRAGSTGQPPQSLAEAPLISRAAAYFPGATDVTTAQVVTVRSGEERTNVDVRVPVVRASRVEGMAIDAQGRPMRALAVGLADATIGSLWGSPGIVQADEAGHFVLPPLTPGRYVLFGRGAERRDGPGPPSSLPLWTETEVLVSGQDLTGVVLRFLPGAIVTGRVTVQGSPLPEGLAKALIGLRPLPAIAGAEVSPVFVPVAADGTFAIPNVPPGKYRLMLTGIASWTLRSAVHAGRDSLDVPLEVKPGENITDLLVTLTDRPAAISGTLFDQLGRPAPEFAVVVFSANREHWTTAPRRMSGLVKIGSDGQFKVSGLPPGDYLLVAVTDAEPTQLQDPAFLDELVPGAIRVTLGESEQRVQDLKLGG